MENKSLRIKEGRTELTVDHQGKDLTFVYPVVGPSTYIAAANELQEKQLKQPTLSEITSLVYSAFESNDKYSEEIKRIMKNNWLWGFTGNLYVPGEGVYIQDNPEIIDRGVSMNKKSLVEKLEANDSSVRFVPFGYKVGEQSSKDLVENKYIIGLVGEEGADKLAKIADKHLGKSYVYSFDRINEELTRVSALGSNWGDYGLCVDGDGRMDDVDGCVFGVLE